LYHDARIHKPHEYGVFVEWYLKKISCPGFTSSAKNPAVTRPGQKPGLRGDQSATNGLSAGNKLETKLYGVTLHNKIYV